MDYLKLYESFFSLSFFIHLLKLVHFYFFYIAFKSSISFLFRKQQRDGKSFNINKTDGHLRQKSKVPVFVLYIELLLLLLFFYLHSQEMWLQISHSLSPIFNSTEQSCIQQL